ncbi:hypothetical protein V3851_05360 [Paenibacillus sp. M1]|uniref:Uncharacterized protein n=1 Tax=Paenibacillus haidiansis TaxID=1574488 RepID=A0ABU7VNB9_9BACL
MKKTGYWRFAALILFACLLVSLFFNVKWLPYKQTQQQSYSLLLDQSFNYGIDSAVTETDSVIEQLRGRAADEEILLGLGNVSAK